MIVFYCKCAKRVSRIYIVTRKGTAQQDEMTFPFSHLHYPVRKSKPTLAISTNTPSLPTQPCHPATPQSHLLGSIPTSIIHSTTKKNSVMQTFRVVLDSTMHLIQFQNVFLITATSQTRTWKIRLRSYQRLDNHALTYLLLSPRISSRRLHSSSCVLRLMELRSCRAAN